MCGIVSNIPYLRYTEVSLKKQEFTPLRAGIELSGAIHYNDRLPYQIIQSDLSFS